MSNKNRPIVIAGFPRSGNTLLGYLLSVYFNAKYIDLHVWPSVKSRKANIEAMVLSEEFFCGSSETDKYESNISAILKTHYGFGNFMQEHFELSEEFGLKQPFTTIMITRDPRDAVVSFFYYKFFRRAKQLGRWYSWIPTFVRIPLLKITILENFINKFAANWSEFTISWLDESPTEVVYFESITRDPLSCIRKIVHSMGLVFDFERATHAVEICSLENMRKLEQAKNPNLKTHEMKTRKGSQGTWKTELPIKIQKGFSERIKGAASRLKGAPWDL